MGCHALSRLSRPSSRMRNVSSRLKLLIEILERRRSSNSGCGFMLAGIIVVQMKNAGGFALVIYINPSPNPNVHRLLEVFRTTRMEGNEYRQDKRVAGDHICVLISCMSSNCHANGGSASTY